MGCPGAKPAGDYGHSWACCLNYWFPWGRQTPVKPVSIYQLAYSQLYNASQQWSPPATHVHHVAVRLFRRLLDHLGIPYSPSRSDDPYNWQKQTECRKTEGIFAKIMCGDVCNGRPLKDHRLIAVIVCQVAPVFFFSCFVAQDESFTLIFCHACCSSRVL